MRMRTTGNGRVLLKVISCAFHSIDRKTSMTATLDELTVASGLLCSVSLELPTSAGRGRGLCQMRTRGGCKNCIFLRTSFMDDPFRSYLTTVYLRHRIRFLLTNYVQCWMELASQCCLARTCPATHDDAMPDCCVRLHTHLCNSPFTAVAVVVELCHSRSR